MTQKNKAIYFFCVISFGLLLSVKAQIKISYHFGSIGTTGDTSVKLSEPVLIGYEKCFDITNGISKFAKPKMGAFSILCNEASPKVALLVHAYPNPVVNMLTIRSLVNYPERGLVKYRIEIADFSGKKIRDVMTDIASINAGFALRVADIPMGYFIVTLYSEKELIQSFKILKG